MAPQLLRRCYRNSLELARRARFRSIAFHCISTGIYGYPGGPAAQIAINAVEEHRKQSGFTCDVVFCCYSPADYAIYERLLAGIAQ